MSLEVELRRNWEVDGVLTDVSTALLSDPTGDFGIEETVSGTNIVADGTAMTKESTGVYTYTFDEAAGLVADTAYTAWIEFTTVGGSVHRWEHSIAAIPAANSLSVSYSRIRRAIGRMMGWNRDPSNWEADQTTDCADIIRAGLRKFYFPLNPEDGLPYGWSFLQKEGSVTLVTGDYDYDMPTDFAVLAEDPVLVDSAGTESISIARVHWKDLEAMRADEAATADQPFYCAVKPKTFSATVGTRYEMILYPAPAADLDTETIKFRYSAEPDNIDVTNVYPQGGIVHSEAILQACLAATEEILKKVRGVHTEEFGKQLAASMRTDKEAKL